MFCLKNLYSKFENKFGGDTLLIDLMMTATKTAHFEARKAKLLQIKEVSLQAYNWLDVIPKQKWQC